MTSKKIKLYVSKIMDGLWYIYGDIGESFDDAEGKMDGKKLYLTFWKVFGFDDYIEYVYETELDELDPNKEYSIFIDNVGRGQFVAIIFERELEQKLDEKAKVVEARLIKESMV